ncbi:carbon storage regulator CsrA [Timonella senegalensis]|uniref:carbon storage regulator CsrA n=1 Tax=Timonella senegalensis TaxID=1465825 RepID=UPI0028A6E5C5|nr:carbon storage regulator CsrA [Timonella senegalensis]
MLVLSRRVGEKLLIGDDIEVVILDSRGDGVRIGINAPRDMKIHRAEVADAVKEADVASAHKMDVNVAVALLEANDAPDDNEDN